MESTLRIEKKDRRKYIVIDLLKLKKTLVGLCVLASLGTLLSLSYSMNKLFFTELATASFIIICVLFVKLRGESK